MTNIQFASLLRDISKNYKTVYMWGTFGSPVTQSIINQKVSQYPSRYSKSRQTFLKKHIGDNFFAFDCVGLIKGVLWGWNGDKDKTYGGAVYYSNGVPDATSSGIMCRCKKISTEINNDMPVGAALYMPGHIGIYLGGGETAECTLDDNRDGVVITKLSDRKWIKHGLLPYIQYEESTRHIKPGDKVTLKKDACIYGKDSKFASFVYDDVWIVSQINEDRAVINKNKSGTNAICSPVSVSDLILTE